MGDLLTASARCVLGTMHGKEQAISPALAGLGLDVVLPTGLDTDAFGTFTGEVHRPPVLEALRAKAKAASRLAPGAAFAAASEGTFGPHPDVFLAMRGAEHVLLMHVESGVEVVGVDVTFDTNAASCDVDSTDAARAFARRVGLPEHGVIVREGGTSGRVLARGVRDESELLAHVERRLLLGGVRLEADMRAHVNPTRMRAIRRAAEDAVERWRSTCARCARPGFSPTGIVPGLPCAACGTETEYALATTLRCVGCGHREERPRADGLTAVDPRYCGECNP